MTLLLCATLHTVHHLRKILVLQDVSGLAGYMTKSAAEVIGAGVKCVCKYFPAG